MAEESGWQPLNALERNALLNGQNEDQPTEVLEDTGWQPGAQNESSRWIVKGLDGKDYRVVDADTAKEVDENGYDVKGAKSIRISGFDAPESKFVSPGQLGGLTEGQQAAFQERGSEEAKLIFFNYLNHNKGNLRRSNEGETFGKFGGSREQATFVNTETGAPLSTALASEGLVQLSQYTSPEDQDAYHLGFINRAIEGEVDQSYLDVLDKTYQRFGVDREVTDEEQTFEQKLRGLQFKDVTFNPYTTASVYTPWDDTITKGNIFKGNAFDEKTYSPYIYDNVDYRTPGTQLWDNERNRSGTTLNPFTDAWHQGWSGVRQGAFEAADIFGTALGSQTIRDWAKAGSTVESDTQNAFAPAPVRGIRDIRWGDGDGSLELSDVKTAIGDSWTLLGTTFTTSLPYMGVLLAASLVSPTTPAAILTAGGRAAAGEFIGAFGSRSIAGDLIAGGRLGAGLLSAPSVYAGEIWGNLDAKNKVASNIPAVIVAGVANATLDELGLIGTVKPSKLFTKFGQTQVEKKLGLATGEGKALIGSTAAKHATAALDDVVKVSNQSVKLATSGKNLATVVGSAAGRAVQRGGKSLGSLGVRALPSAATEGLTEVLQETNTALTSAYLNGRPVDPQQFSDTIITAGLAGALIGGGFHAGSSVLGDLRKYQLEAKIAQRGDPDNYNDAFQRNIDAGRLDTDKQLKDTMRILENEMRGLSSSGLSKKEVNSRRKFITGQLDTLYKDLRANANTSDNLLVTKEYRQGELDPTPYGSTEELAKKRKRSNFLNEDRSIRIPTGKEFAESIAFGAKTVLSGDLSRWLPAATTKANKFYRSIAERVLPGKGSGAAALEDSAQTRFNEGVMKLNLEGMYSDLGLLAHKDRGKAGKQNRAAAKFDILAAAVGQKIIGIINDDPTINQNKIQHILNEKGAYQEFDKDGNITSDLSVNEVFNQAGVKFNIDQWKAFNKNAIDSARLIYQLEKMAAVRNFGPDSIQAQQYADSFKPDYFWVSRRLTKEKVKANKSMFITAFSQIIEKQKAVVKAQLDSAVKTRDKAQSVVDNNPSEANRKNLSKAERAVEYYEKKSMAVNSATPEGTWKEIVDADPNTTPYSVFEGSFFGSPMFARNFDLSEQTFNLPGEKTERNFADMFMDNRFGESTIERIRRSTRTSTLQDYFGDGGVDMDYLLNQAIKEDIANGVPEAEAIERAGGVAKSIMDMTDVMTGNYKRNAIPKWLAKAQNYVMSYTTFIALPLGAITSLPENMMGLLGVATDKETQQFLFQATANLREALGQISKEEAEIYRNSDVHDSPLMLSFMYEQLALAGIPVDEGSIYDRYGAEFSRGNGEFIRKAQDVFFSAIQLNSLTTYQRAFALSQGLRSFKTSLDGLQEVFDADTGTFKPLNDMQQTLLARLQANSVDVVNLLRTYKRIQQSNLTGSDLVTMTNINEDIFSQSDLNQYSIAPEMYEQTEAYQSSTNTMRDIDFFRKQLQLYNQNFVNFRIQNPQAANRALIWQDPRFALVTQFNGFLSTATTTIVPYLWKQQVGGSFRKIMQGQAPTELYPFFQMVIVLTAMGFLSGALKDFAKGNWDDDKGYDPFDFPFSEDNDYINLLRRAVNNAGILGQFEKPISWVIPDAFSQREGFSDRVRGDALGPAGIHLGNAKQFLQAEDAAHRWNVLIKSTPLISPFTGWRHDVANTLAGGDGSLGKGTTLSDRANDYSDFISKYTPDFIKGN